MASMLPAPMYRRIALPEIVDHRGRLFFAEVERHIPFPIRRFFCISGVGPGVTRGGHAHREQHQFIVMLAGECAIAIDDGRVVAEERLTSGPEGIYLPPGIWLEMR